jgi:hypothetical protein
VIQRAEEIGFSQGNPQNRHLQPGKPDPDARWNAFFLQDGLEHQRHNFDCGLFALGLSLFLELGGLLAQLSGYPGNARRAVIFHDGAAAGCRIAARTTRRRWPDRHCRRQRR